MLGIFRIIKILKVCLVGNRLMYYNILSIFFELKLIQWALRTKGR